MQVSGENIIIIIFCLTCLFIVATLFLVFYVGLHTKRKKNYQEEKLEMRNRFERELIKTQLEVQEQTQRNLSSDLHDNIGQLLSLTNVTLASVNLKDIEKSDKKIQAAQGLVEKSIKEIRQLSKLMQGEKLLQQGLEEAVKQEVQWFQRNEYYKIYFESEIDRLPENNAAKDLFVYRLLQECLNNIIKHAEATMIYIKLSYERKKLLLEIRDNGKGFNKEETLLQNKGIGIQNMKRRVTLLNGDMQMDSHANNGTAITFTIPYE